MKGDELDANVIDATYSSQPPTTAETKTTLGKFRDRLRSSMRIAARLVMEDDEFQKARNRERKTPFPSY